MEAPKNDDNSLPGLDLDFTNVEQSYENAAELSRNDSERVVVLNFKALQLLRIKSIQRELFAMQMRLRLGGVTLEQYPKRLKLLDDLLDKYVNALRNYELLAENSLSCVPKGAKLFGAPPDLAERETKPRRRLLDSIFPWQEEPSSTGFELRDWTKYTQYSDRAAGGNFILNKSLEYRELDSRTRKSHLLKNAVSERLAMALFGGTALIVPMLIMALRPGITIALITVSIATLIFALVLAFFAVGSMGKDVLAATAAYAAVLVVFVGTSLTPAPSQGT